MSAKDAEAFRSWLTALEARHLADLRTSEVTRALRALSSLYVERRHEAGARTALDTAGKRAAFALFYGPLHFLTTYLVVQALEASSPPPSLVVDIGCGTGAAGAAFALAAGATPRITGIDRHPWAAAEATWTYRQFGLDGRARQGDVARLPALGQGHAVVAAYLLNELATAERVQVERRLIEATTRGTRVLVIEPIARRMSPWWDDAAERMIAGGGRADEWRFPVELLGIVGVLDRAAGLDHQELTARSLYCPGAAGRAPAAASAT